MRMFGCGEQKLPAKFGTYNSQGLGFLAGEQDSPKTHRAGPCQMVRTSLPNLQFKAPPTKSDHILKAENPPHLLGFGGDSMQSFKCDKREGRLALRRDKAGFGLQCSWGMFALHECLNKIIFMHFSNV